MHDDMGRLGVAPNDHVMSAFFSAASYCSASPAEQEAIFGALALYRWATRALRWAVLSHAARCCVR